MDSDVSLGPYPRRSGFAPSHLASDEVWAEYEDALAKAGNERLLEWFRRASREPSPDVMACCAKEGRLYSDALVQAAKSGRCEMSYRRYLMHALATLHAQRREYGTSLRYLLCELSLLRRAKLRDPRSQASAWSALGYLHASLHQPVLAVTCFSHASHAVLAETRRAAWREREMMAVDEESLCYPLEPRNAPDLAVGLYWDDYLLYESFAPAHRLLPMNAVSLFTICSVGLWFGAGDAQGEYWMLSGTYALRSYIHDELNRLRGAQKCPDSPLRLMW